MKNKRIHTHVYKLYHLAVHQKLTQLCKSAMCACMVSHCSHVRLFVTLWTTACQVPLSMGFSRQEYWSGLYALLPGIFLTQGSNPRPWQACSLPLALPEKPTINYTSIK